ncbi:MAG: ABC transporter ATP-binding protein, partial [Gammaproteobacteria bacterium]|nr:ABC transporter ATP-binding protein [Gammaproteobacteria bacterium]
PGYQDWVRQREIDPFSDTPLKQDVVKPIRAADRRKPVKLSYKDQRELERLPEQIEKLETRVQQLTQAMSEPDFYQQDKSDILQTQQALEDANRELEACYQRWEELESVQL